MRRRAQVASTEARALWLTAGSLAKYVALPLGLLAFAQLIGKPKREWARAALVAAACVALAVLMSLPFVRDLSFMNDTLRMRNWRWLTPAVRILISPGRYL